MGRFYILLTLIVLSISSIAKDSPARVWNEVLLECIRLDFARPTVHARNLYHHSLAMYDIWSAIDGRSETCFLGKTVGNYTNEFEGFSFNGNNEFGTNIAISYASHKILRYRFRNAPNVGEIYHLIDSVFIENGGNANFISADYTGGNPAALGNFVGASILEYGSTDGANEANDYANLFYTPVNLPIAPQASGNPDIVNPNRWQQLLLDVIIDQSGNVIRGNSQPFLGAEWGVVTPFALQPNQQVIKTRDGNDFRFYHDPGHPPYLDYTSNAVMSGIYQWGFGLVADWSSHLSPDDGVRWDISPRTMGNVGALPTKFEDFESFYHLGTDGVLGAGRTVNPKTGQPYASQIVPRGDFTRALAEFWADGPSSETPPGHWFTLLNYVSDHPQCEHKFEGSKQMESRLMWDVYSYLLMGGAMHDVAVTTWGMKGYYDYIRPISALRYMADKGQSSDPSLPNYNEDGIKLIPGVIELVTSTGPIGRFQPWLVNKIKVKAWRGPNYIGNPATGEAGVGWILMENWWPYQRPSFVTPPFAGYVSGHSTFSRAAAEVLTLFTGDEFFPGGMGEFLVKRNEFLVFEEGPSVTFKLQWATYRDAAAQSGLSRIWGGIHPPMDDVPGRLIGEKIGIGTFEFAKPYLYPDRDMDGFDAFVDLDDSNPTIYPNAPELCDGLDNNGNGEIDEGLPVYTYFLDNDGDGFGDVSETYVTCNNELTIGFVIDSTDCNDSNTLINPDAEEILDNGLDDNCDGEIENSIVKFYPNPAYNELVIEHYTMSIAGLTLYNSIGQKVLNTPLDSTLVINKFDISEIRQGFYIAVLTDLENEVILTKKILIE